MKYICILLMIFPLACQVPELRRPGNSMLSDAVYNAVRKQGEGENITNFRFVHSDEWRIESSWYDTHVDRIVMKIIVHMDGMNYQVRVEQRSHIAKTSEAPWAIRVKREVEESIAREMNRQRR